MKEVWKDIEGYEGKYQVSNTGKVRSVNYNKTGKMKELTLANDKIGYKHIELSKGNDRKTYLVHRLVAQAFLPNPDNLTCVNHKDECKSNNTVDNLEWCTHKYNSNYGTAIQRQIQTKIDKGIYTGLSRQEYNKQYMATWKKENKEKVHQYNVEYLKKYRETHKEYNKEYKKKYYQEHKQQIKEKRRLKHYEETK